MLPSTGRKTLQLLAIAAKSEIICPVGNIFKAAVWGRMCSQIFGAATCCTLGLQVFLCVFLQLLGEILLDRHNFTVMTRYISKAENLKLMMNLLRDNSPNIQFEAFHVFKVARVNSERQV